MHVLNKQLEPVHSSSHRRLRNHDHPESAKMAVSITRESSVGLRLLDPSELATLYDYPRHQSTASGGAYSYGLCRRGEPYFSCYQPMTARFGHWDYAARQLAGTTGTPREVQPQPSSSYYHTLVSLHAARAAGFVAAAPATTTLLNPRSFKTFYIDEEKPNQSYIGLIGQAIMSLPENKMVLSDIYKWVLTHYPYFRNKGPGWKNSVRHNLSLNDCFVKAGRSPNGKGNFWAINPENYDDFRRGDFRRRRAQRRAKKYSPSHTEKSQNDVESINSSDELCLTPDSNTATATTKEHEVVSTNSSQTKCQPKLYRTFDVENLLGIH